MSDTSEQIKQQRLELAKYLDVVSLFDEDKEFQVLFEVRKITPEEMKVDSLPTLINDFVISLNLMPFNAFGELRIREVEEVEACAILVNILSQDLAYNGPR